MGREVRQPDLQPVSGRELPPAASANADVVVELMWHDRAEYPAADSRAAVGVLEWIQYKLDTASTINDIREKTTSATEISGRVPLHYLVADRRADQRP